MYLCVYKFLIQHILYFHNLLMKRIFKCLIKPLHFLYHFKEILRNFYYKKKNGRKHNV